MFASSYTTIYFFAKNFFSNIYISVNAIFECSYLSLGWKIGHPLSMYITKGMEGGHPECVQVRTEGEGYHASCIRTHLHYPFSCFFLMVSCLVSCSIEKGCLCQKWLFFSNEINFCCNEISFFLTLNSFSEPNLVKTLLILTK